MGLSYEKVGDRRSSSDIMGGVREFGSPIKKRGDLDARAREDATRRVRFCMIRPSAAAPSINRMLDLVAIMHASPNKEKGKEDMKGHSAEPVFRARMPPPPSFTVSSGEFLARNTRESA